jgi:YGGT family protein
MNPAQPPAEPPRNPWAGMEPALPSEPTRPNLTPPRPLATPDNPAWPAQYPTRTGAPNGRAGRGWWSAGRIRQIVFLILSVLETLLVIRFFLKLLGANPDAAFTIFIYGVTELFVAPFEGVFPSLQTRGSMLDLAALLAMIVYALLAWLIVSAIETLASRRLSRPA